MGRLRGYKVLVVHAGSDLARACALRIAQEGADVFAVDPLTESLDRLVENLTEVGLSVRTMRADPGSESEIARVITECGRLWECLDVLLVCASVSDWWEQDAETMEDWESLIRVNLLTPVFYARYARRMLARSGRGSVIFIGSIDGEFGNPRLPAYSASKGGLIPSAHVLAHDLGFDGIRVNVVSSAGISANGPDTPSRRVPSKTDPKEVVRANAIRRRARAEEIASLVAYLASEEASYITGANIRHDGGRTAITPGTGSDPDIGFG